MQATITAKRMSADSASFLTRVDRTIRRILKKTARLREARRLGVAYVQPNFVYWPQITEGAVVIDAGCSYEAEFSRMMMERHGARAFAVDPTLKHRSALEAIERAHPGRFTLLPFAISDADGTLAFHESKVNESGSLMADHVNVRRGDIVKYDVRAIGLRSLVSHIGGEEVDILKLDIEGAEYELLAKVGREDLAPFKQIFIEFHHHAVARYSEADTRRLVERIRGFGFESFSLDDHNYIFRRRARGEADMQDASPKPLRLAILQRICAGYRADLFSRIASSPGVEAKLFYGEDIPDSKVKGLPNVTVIPNARMKTRFLRFGRRVMPWHSGLVKELREFAPDVILCEGESHFLGYLQAIVYKLCFNRKAALMHWCFIGLPGKPLKETRPADFIKAFFRRFFNAFVLYSSFSKDCLTRLGVDPGKAFVATNVGDVGKFLKLADSVPESTPEARKALGLPERFTALYVGTLDAVKRPEVMLELAEGLPKDQYNFVLLGAGPMLESLRVHAAGKGLDNVFLPGRVVQDLAKYYRASDVLLIPGRGGIVISEAMAFGIPVIVHEADGTEYDLVQDGVTGTRLEGASVAHFRAALESLRASPGKCAEMGRTGREMVQTRFTTENMASQILKAARYAAAKKQHGAQAAPMGQPVLQEAG